MEHRWGKRVSVDFPVQLRSTSGAVAAGRIADVSTSGALIRTDLKLDPLMRVDIFIGDLPVPAYVVRTPSGAVGVEWCELAPDIVSAILLAPVVPPPESQPVVSPRRAASAGH